MVFLDLFAVQTRKPKAAPDHARGGKAGRCRRAFLLRRCVLAAILGHGADAAQQLRFGRCSKKRALLCRDQDATVATGKPPHARDAKGETPARETHVVKLR